MEPDALTYAVAALATARTYHYVDQKPACAVAAALLCLHGFPDLSFGWRHQIQPWVAQGYRVIAPDMLGYGKTDMPLEPSAYTTKRLCDDLAALLDHLGIQKAVVIGHDWGSYVAGRFALWHPKRLLALALLSIPYTPPSTDYVSLEERVLAFPAFGYQLYLASEKSTVDIEAHLSLFFQSAFRATPLVVQGRGSFQNALLNGAESEGCILGDKELDYYLSNFQRGMTGPLSYYRTNQLRFQEEKDAALPSKLPTELPVLYLYGTRDPTSSPTASRNMGKFINQLKVVPIPEIGHWVMLEAAETVTEVILQWTKSALGSKEPVHL